MPTNVMTVRGVEFEKLALATSNAGWWNAALGIALRQRSINEHWRASKQGSIVTDWHPTLEAALDDLAARLLTEAADLIAAANALGATVPEGASDD